MPALFYVRVYLEIEENETETPVKEETTVQYTDGESLNGTLVSNN